MCTNSGENETTVVFSGIIQTHKAVRLQHIHKYLYFYIKAWTWSPLGPEAALRIEQKLRCSWSEAPTCRAGPQTSEVRASGDVAAKAALKVMSAPFTHNTAAHSNVCESEHRTTYRDVNCTVSTDSRKTHKAACLPELHSSLLGCCIWP